MLIKDPFEALYVTYGSRVGIALDLFRCLWYDVRVSQI